MPMEFGSADKHDANLMQAEELKLEGKASVKDRHSLHRLTSGSTYGQRRSLQNLNNSYLNEKRKSQASLNNMNN